MRVDFRGLPGRDEPVARPLVDIHVPGLPEVGLACLIDTGALGNRFAQWIADAAGIDVSGAERETVAIGGHLVVGRTLDMDLRLGEYHWRAPVSFCDPWPWEFQLLGQEGFLRFFDVCVSASAMTLELTPAAS